MKCKFEHDGYCCNSRTFRFKDTCDMKNCDYCAPMSRGDVLRTCSDEILALTLSLSVTDAECLKRIKELNKAGLSYEDAWLKWLQEPVAGAL